MSDFQMKSLERSSSFRGKAGFLSSSRSHREGRVIPSSPSKTTSSSTMLSGSMIFKLTLVLCTLAR
ncbi:hypothetical protein EYF80_043605 [Liparis tanakae]|uniref:Uncharacterized protein n=1 Tax=Liparis tanakae TaxID=230148 RepID=A0A4Z2FY12_9TELE|nr:hypothetical protein EYF80_043605 [Liparis tanakae]